MVSNTITITYGDQAENHVGMQKIGKLAVSGLTIDDLQMAKERFEKIDCKCELINLNEYVDECKSNIDPAAILIIRNGINKLLSDKISDDMYFEQNKLDVDKKAFMYGRVVNKHARHNLCFDDNNQEPDYVNGKGRIVSWENVPLTNKIRKLLPDYFGPKTNNLTSEGNYYYDVNKCYIGYHGDTERKIVIAARLGASLPLHYTWFKNNKPVGKTFKVILNHGDLYAMCEKATGNDWKKSSMYTLRHAAGQEKNIKIKQK
jgi:hypothetical protein